MNRRCVFLSTRATQKYANYSEDEEEMVAYDLLPLEKIQAAVAYCSDNVNRVCLKNESEESFFENLTIVR